jgi:tRNA(Ile)-lysidine synthase TilS/MesJ
VRPLLGVSRTEILHYLGDRGIAYRHDASNGDLGLARNRARRELASASREQLDEMARELARLVEERAQLERAYAEEIAPHVRADPQGAHIDAALLSACPAELQRLALERLAAPLARPGRPPMTGREREQILALLEGGGDFRFEAGRRIRFLRRGTALRIQARPPATVYDSASTVRESEGVAS